MSKHRVVVSIGPRGLRHSPGRSLDVFAPSFDSTALRGIRHSELRNHSQIQPMRHDRADAIGYASLTRRVDSCAGLARGIENVQQEPFRLLPIKIHRSTLLIGGLAILIQTAYLWTANNDPTLSTPIIDAKVYHDAAVRFANGQPLYEGNFWQPPLFPLLLGVIYRVFGVSLLAARLVLVALFVADCLLIARIGEQLFSKPVGLVSGLMAAAYGPLLFFSTRLLPVAPAVFLILIAITLWIRHHHKPRLGTAALLGLSVGLATITVPNAGVLFILVAGGMLLGGLTHRRLRFAMASTSILYTVGALPIAAVTVRNYVVSGDFVAISTNGGINFFIGNNLERHRTLAIRPGEHWRRLARESYRGGARTRAQQSRFFTSQTIDYIIEEPSHFVLGLWEKSRQLIHAREIPRNLDAYAHRKYSRVLGPLLWRTEHFAFPFGLIGPLAAVGIIAALRDPAASQAQRIARRVAITFIVGYGVSVVLFFVSARYRLPMTLICLPFAAYSTVWLGRQFLRKDQMSTRRTWFQVAAVFLAFTMIVNLPMYAATDSFHFRAEEAMCLGHAYAEHGDIDRSLASLREALTLEPRYVAAGTKLGQLLANAGRAAEGQRWLRDAVSWDDNAAEPRQVLGEWLRQQGRWDEAQVLLEEAVAIDPTFPEALGGLAEVYVHAQQPTEAIKHLRLAADVAQNPGPYYVRLADLLSQRGQYSEAIDFYRRALWMVEPEPALLNRIAWLLATCPKPELRDCHQAMEIAEQLCQLTEFGEAVALDTLAAAHAECQQWSRAVDWSRRAIQQAQEAGDAEAVNSFKTRLAIYERQLRNTPPERNNRGNAPQTHPPGKP